MNRNDQSNKDGRNDNGGNASKGDAKDAMQKEQDRLRHEQLRKMTEGGNDTKYRPDRVIEKMGKRGT